MLQLDRLCRNYSEQPWSDAYAQGVIFTFAVAEVVRMREISGDDIAVSNPTVVTNFMGVGAAIPFTGAQVEQDGVQLVVAGDDRVKTVRVKLEKQSFQKA